MHLTAQSERGESAGRAGIFSLAASRPYKAKDDNFYYAKTFSILI